MKVKPIWALVFFVVFVIIYRVFGYTGHFGYDDMEYAEIAANFLNGTVDFDNHFTHRFTIILATALSYKLFGINDVASSIPSILVTIGILTVVFALLRKRGFMPTFFGLAVTALTNHTMFYSNKLMPDIYVALFVVLAVYFYYQYRFTDKGGLFFCAIGFAFSLFLGFSSKGTIVLVIPLLLYLFLSDLLTRQNKSFWIWSVAAGILIMLAYFIVIKAVTGEFMYRFKAIAQNSYLNTCSYDQQPFGILIKRLFFDFFDMIITNVMAVPIVFVIAAFIRKDGYQVFKMQTPTDFFATVALLLFLSSNFMTISATSYIPMCIDIRHYLFIVPVAAVAAACFVSEKPTRNQLYAILGMFVFLTLYSFFSVRQQCYRVYLPMTMVAGLAIWFKHKQIKNQWLFIAFIAAIAILPVKTISTARYYEYENRRDALINEVLCNTDTLPVVTDNVCARMMRYYAGFSTDKKIFSFDEFDGGTSRAEKALLVLNYHTMALNGISYSDLPYYASQVLAKQTPYFDKYGMRIFKMDSIETQQIDTLFISKNNFDGDVPEYWRAEPLLSQKTSCSGQNSNRVKKYSATFDYPIDSLHCAGYDTVFVGISANCNCYSKTNCAIVVSVENQNCSFSWNSAKIGSGVVAFSHWYKFEYEQELHLKEYPSDAVVRIYFYKTDWSEVYIDDFEISICKHSN